LCFSCGCFWWCIFLTFSAQGTHLLCLNTVCNDNIAVTLSTYKGNMVNPSTAEWIWISSPELGSRMNRPPPTNKED
jgi:hypothetical protein